MSLCNHKPCDSPWSLILLLVSPSLNLDSSFCIFTVDFSKIQFLFCCILFSNSCLLLVFSFVFCKWAIFPVPCKLHFDTVNRDLLVLTSLQAHTIARCSHHGTWSFLFNLFGTTYYRFIYSPNLLSSWLVQLCPHSLDLSSS